tara:strand:- start:1002 stop:1259 length:258 start_codon:yes stop_codon:yes gene_type:complete
MIKLKFKNLNLFMSRKLNNRLNIIFVFPGLGSLAKEYEYFSDCFNQKNQVIIIEFPGIFIGNNKINDYLFCITKEIFLFIKKKKY